MRYVTICLAALAIGFGFGGSANAQIGGGPSPFSSLPRLQPSAPVYSPARTLDSEGLRQMLVSIGYQPQVITPAPGLVAYTIELKHADGVRKHFVGIDKVNRTVILVGGGVYGAPNPAVASNAWFQKLLTINNRIAPNSIFMNDKKVFGVTTTTGNSEVTADVLRQRISLHISTFDRDFMPLMKELLQAGSYGQTTNPVSSLRY